MARNTKKNDFSPRAEALALLLRIEQDDAYADRLLASSLPKTHEARDRAFIRELVLGALRWQLRLDHIINMYYTNKPGRLDIEVRLILRLGLLQMMFMDSVPDWAAINESVVLVRLSKKASAAGLVNAILRRFQRDGEPPLSETDPVKRLSVMYAHPEWLVRRWIKAFGEDTAELECAAGVKKHPVTIRANRLLTTPKSLGELLEEEGFTTIPSEYDQSYLTVENAGGLFSNNSFHSGLFTAQDPSARMAVMLLNPEPGDRILDMCAAPGGKTTHMAELADDKATIDAVDVNTARLGLVEEAAQRLGVTSVTCLTGDATTFTPSGSMLYDKILCDVPCSGTAVLSKRPDMKWRRTKNDIKRMVSLQKDILTHAVTLVRPGGIIIYSTCTMEHEENEDMIRWFTHSYPFSIEHNETFADYEIESGYRILPHQMGGAGAFAVILRHNGNE